MLFRRFASSIASKFEPIARKVSTVLFVLVLLGAIAAERENIVSYFAQAGLITLVLNIVMMITAYCLAQLFASGVKQKKCITIECGLQNGTLAIFVATSIFGGGMYVIPAATYSLIMFVTSLIFVYLVRKIV
jgi:BASS family bile acid:Na+ symporter